MSHLTKKIKIKKEKNNKNRSVVSFGRNLGVRNMGFESNQARKQFLFDLQLKERS